MNADCLCELVSQVSRPEIGIVGARLWYHNGALQHGGVILGVGGVGSHIDGIRRHEFGYFAREHLVQDFCAVTAACLMVERRKFAAVGGFDEGFVVAGNDVDLGLLYDVEIDDGKVKVIHTLTSMGCPVGPMIQEQIHDVTRALPGVEDVEVELTWDPPWTPEKMSEDAKFILGFG